MWPQCLMRSPMCLQCQWCHDIVLKPLMEFDSGGNENILINILISIPLLSNVLSNIATLLTLQTHFMRLPMFPQCLQHCQSKLYVRFSSLWLLEWESLFLEISVQKMLDDYFIVSLKKSIPWTKIIARHVSSWGLRVTRGHHELISWSVSCVTIWHMCKIVTRAN